MKKKFIIIIDGPMGSGKTTVGELLHKQLKRAALVNMDRIKWFISDYKRSKKDNAITNAVFMAMCDAYLHHGMSVIVAQAFSKKNPLDEFQKLSKKYGARLYVYHLNAPRSVLQERLDRRIYKEHTRPSKSRILRNLRHWDKERYLIGKEFATDQIRAEKIVKEILKDIT